MTSRPGLTIGYSTLGHRAANIELPAQREDTEILIIVQGDASLAPRRSDVRVVELQSRGVAKSRNAALDHARGECLLFGDDDITWNLDGIEQVLTAFEADPRLALVLAQAVDETGALRKKYPTRRGRLSRWNSARAATYEMILRPDAFRGVGVRFDEAFGAGAHNYLGDEFILIADGLANGLQCEALPVTIATHPTDSSGSRYGTTADARARAAVFTRVFGRLAPAVRLGFAVRNYQQFGSPGLALRFVVNKFAIDPQKAT